MTNRPEIDPMLTTGEVARLLNVHINTVRRWSNQGVLRTYRIGARGDRRFRREDITSFIKNDPMLTESQVARLLNVHINTVRRWSDQGVLKAYRNGMGGDRRYHHEDVTRFLSRKSNITNLETDMEAPSPADQPVVRKGNLSASVVYKNK
jgi:excisionase family DNA binding protein